ncbi:MAG: LuxR C-terminal-related transcriptional regulator [Actinobacteria bacterium]|nr:LuxR C-terminal-related transcriptional regulator [Actinomycetota bacterium]
MAPVICELMAAKLAPPRVRPGVVARPRLIDALDAGASCAVTVVCAPAGYGKTLLVAAWCADRAKRGAAPVAWLSLATTENDPGLLLRYLIGALRRADVEVGERAAMMVQVPGASPLACMHSLLNDLAALPQRPTLVLDDYHVITEPVCHELMAMLVDHGDRVLRVMFCTQAEPPIALGSLRAAGQLSELRAHDLRFSVREAAELVRRAGDGLQLDHDTVAMLAARTEGWAAGLYLAALWLRGRGGQQADAQRFGGDNRHVVDYLSEAVLARLDDGTREFLLKTSIVDRLCTSLCEALIGHSATGVLEQIERSNLFVVALDDSRRWYRYHHLFGRMLRSELMRRCPDGVSVLHRRASAWYRRTGLITEAIEHARQAGDLDDVAQMICEHWLQIGRRGQLATLRSWLDGFDREQLQRHPELGVVGGMVTGLSGGSELEFRGWLDLAEDGLTRGDGAFAGTVSLQAGVNVLRSSFDHRNIPAAAIAAAHAARMETETHGELRVGALGNLALLLYLRGDPSAARDAVSEALRDPQAQLRPYGYITALTTAALIAIDGGDVTNAQATATLALTYAATVGLSDNLVSGLAHVALARAQMANHQLEAADTQMNTAMALLRGGVTPSRQVYALLWAAKLARARGDLSAAIGLTDEAEDLLCTFEDAGTLSDLLKDVRRAISRARQRHRAPDARALTEAELAVLRLMRGPDSQRAIARSLSISMNTVKTHRASIYRKLDVSCRQDAVARAVALNLI